MLGVPVALATSADFWAAWSLSSSVTLRVATTRSELSQFVLLTVFPPFQSSEIEGIRWSRFLLGTKPEESQSFLAERHLGKRLKRWHVDTRLVGRH